MRGSPPRPVGKALAPPRLLLTTSRGRAAPDRPQSRRGRRPGSPRSRSRPHSPGQTCGLNRALVRGGVQARSGPEGRPPSPPGTPHFTRASGDPAHTARPVPAWKPGAHPTGSSPRCRHLQGGGRSVQVVAGNQGGRDPPPSPGGTRVSYLFDGVAERETGSAGGADSGRGGISRSLTPFPKPPVPRFQLHGRWPRPHACRLSVLFVHGHGRPFTGTTGSRRLDEAAGESAA